jgi:choice-of-anchor C domain-containing protein
VSAATITNGSFEAPGTFSGSFTTLGAGDPSLTGWSIDSGSIDLINTYWNAAEGDYSIDMSGDGPATISTIISELSIGYRYLITFDVGANPDAEPDIKLLDATIGGFTGQYTAPRAGRPLNWTSYALEFIATAATQTLSFSSAANGINPYGPALDNVEIATVPVPATGMMLLLALGGLVAMRRRASV